MTARKCTKGITRHWCYQVWASGIWFCIFFGRLRSETLAPIAQNIHFTLGLAWGVGIKYDNK